MRESPNNRDYSCVPIELVRDDQWMVCGAKKEPRRAKDRAVSSKTDPANHSAFDVAVACVRHLMEKYEIGYCILDGIIALVRGVSRR
jgi:hypothetical protein